MIVHRPDGSCYQIVIDETNPAFPVHIAVSDSVKRVDLDFGPTEAAQFGRMMINASEASLDVWRPPVTP